MRKLLFALLLSLAGCLTTTSQNMNAVSLGMTKEQVLKVLGPPVSASATQGVEYLNYRFVETIDDARWDRSTPYFVRIVNGRVDAYGRTGDFNSTKPREETINLNIKQ